MSTPRRSAVLLRGATAGPFGDLYRVFWANTTQFCFSYTLEGVTAMPRGGAGYKLSSATHFYFFSRRGMPAPRPACVNFFLYFYLPHRYSI